MAGPNKEAVIALAGGLDSDGNLRKANYSRMNTAIHMVRTGFAKNIVMSGGWSYLSPKPAKTEGLQMADYAIRKGVDPDLILVEDESHDTVGNAYYTKRDVVVPNGWHRLTVVTSGLHLSRSERVFDYVYYEDDDTEGYDISYAVSSQSPNPLGRAHEAIAWLTTEYILEGTARGDDAVIGQRLAEITQLYGSSRLGAVQLVLDSVIHHLKPDTTKT